MFYRIKQFFSAVFARLSKEDIDFLNLHLSEEEMKIFSKLPTHEKKHSINVAHYIIENNRNISDFVIKAGILHDIGKINSHLNPFFKSIIVILDGISEDFTKKLKFIKPIKVYYEHPEIGFETYNDIDREIANLIKEHHNYNNQNPIVKIIQEADCKN